MKAIMDKHLLDPDEDLEAIHIPSESVTNILFLYLRPDWKAVSLETFLKPLNVVIEKVLEMYQNHLKVDAKAAIENDPVPKMCFSQKAVAELENDFQQLVDAMITTKAEDLDKRMDLQRKIDGCIRSLKLLQEEL